MRRPFGCAVHEVRVYDAQERAPETSETPEFQWWMTLDDPSQCA